MLFQYLFIKLQQNYLYNEVLYYENSKYTVKDHNNKQLNF